jgi:hypothetical protein
MTRVLIACFALALCASASADDKTPAAAAPAAKPAAGAPAAPAASKPAPGSSVYFIAPEDGATVGRVFSVKFGLTGMGVAPAGVVHDGSGHHHLLVDAKAPPKAGQPIPNDANHLHFGGGQTETSLALPPGDHTLQLVFGDAGHQPFDPSLMSKVITVHVK